MKTKILKLYFDRSISCKWGMKKSLFINYNAQMIRYNFDKWSAENNYDNSVYRISDCFPFSNDILLINKPYINIQNIENRDVSFRKKMKILEYIPLEALTDYFLGKLDGNAMKVLEENIGIFSVLNSGELKFNNNSGLYFILRIESDDLMKKFISFMTKFFENFLMSIVVSDFSLIANPSGNNFCLLESIRCDSRFKKDYFNNCLYQLGKNEELDGKILIKSGSVFSENIREINSSQVLMWRF